MVVGLFVCLFDCLCRRTYGNLGLLFYLCFVLRIIYAVILCLVVCLELRLVVWFVDDVWVV